MPKLGRWSALLPLVSALVLTSVPAYAGGAPSGVTASDEGFVPVAIWELKREGFPMIRHAWVAGSEHMLRVSWDDGVTWFGFRPMYADVARGMLAIKVVKREELGRGEVAWQDKAGLTIVTGVPGKTAFPATTAAPGFEVTLTLVEVKDVSPSELKAAPTTSATMVDGQEPPPVTMNQGGGGAESCCVSCQGMRVCDCSVCIPECHASCCLGGCFCQSC